MRRACRRARLRPLRRTARGGEKEGKIVLYTANFLDTEQAVVKRFTQRFPGIQIEIVRAPTGSLSRA
jgi:iron(III) transport system substrate-binding protein